MGLTLDTNGFYPLLHSSAKSPPTLPNDPTLIESDEEVAQLIDAIPADLKLDAIASTARTIQAVSRFIAEAKAYNPEYAILHCENRLELQIGYGDVLEWPGPGAIALACDDRFDLVKHGEGSQLYEVAGWPISKAFPQSPLTGRIPHTHGQTAGGSKLDDRFEVGHVSVTPLAERAATRPTAECCFWLCCIPSGTGVARSRLQPMRRMFGAPTRAYGRPLPIGVVALAVPLFGAGQSGTLLSQQQSCTLAVLSAVCVALRQPIYPRLRLLCHDRDRYRALNLRAIAQAAGLERGPRT